MYLAGSTLEDIVMQGNKHEITKAVPLGKNDIKIWRYTHIQ